MLPSRYPELNGYPFLRQMLASQVDMQFEDVRTLLRLPSESTGLAAGCNFSTAAILLNLLSGISLCFHNANLSDFEGLGNRGRRFRELIRSKYPDEDDVLRQDLVNALYDAARNPLAHTLGFVAPSNQPSTRIVFLKSPLTQEQVTELEESEGRPSWLPPTISKSKLADGTIEYQLAVNTLYWGLHRVLHQLFSDTNQAALSEDLATSLTRNWTRYVSDSGHAIESVSVARFPSAEPTP